MRPRRWLDVKRRYLQYRRTVASSLDPVSEDEDDERTSRVTAVECRLANSPESRGSACSGHPHIQRRGGVHGK